MVVDTTIRPTGEGHPFGYFDQEAIEQGGDPDTRRMIREYDPTWEMINSLLKSEDRVSTYRVGVLSAEQRENLSERVVARNTNTLTRTSNNTGGPAARSGDFNSLGGGRVLRSH